jgi:hypothetical protein
LPELAQIRVGKSPAKPPAEIVGQPLDEFLSITGPFFAALYEFNEPPSQLPVGHRHGRIDRARRGSARIFQQAAQIRDQSLVV